jgi:hypothetical protein
MKKIAVIFFAFVVAVLMIASCEQETSIAVKVRDYPEILEVNGTTYNLFSEEYKNFIDALDDDKKTMIADYTQNSIKKPFTQKLTVNCNCQPEDRGCSAIGAYSECCICCTAPQSAACGVYFGLASCQCSGGNPTPRLQNTSPPVTIYPRNIAKLINYANMNGITTKGITKSFEVLINSNN